MSSMYIGVMRNLRHELYGESVFTSFRTFNGQVYGLEEHFKRLYEAVRDVYFMKTLTYSQFFNYFCIDIRASYLNKYPNHYIRMTIFSDQTNSSLNQKSFGLCDLELSISIKDLGEARSSLRLKSFSSPYSKSYIPIKSGSYFQNLYFKRKGIEQGYDDILFTVDDEVVEASTSNIIFQRGNDFFFPAGHYFLQGITLKLFKEFCRFKSFKIYELDIKKNSIRNYDQAFLLNSVQGLVSVKSIDEYEFIVDHSRKLNDHFLKFCEENLCRTKN
jgi:branched-subunit amino acid aminotransferase/4-amino-4-deoxychorismate lyase